jgi:hypothetical protein
MIRRRTCPGTFPITRLLDPRREQRLRTGCQPFDQIELHPHIGRRTQRHNRRVERIDQHADRTRHDPHTRPTNLHVVVVHDRHAHIMATG